jgi:hypothetical protein
MVFYYEWSDESQPMNQTESTTLEKIALILQEFKDDKNPSIGDYIWALEMIQVQISQKI